MLSISGEVRKVIDREYNDSKGKPVKQAVIVLEPSDAVQNYEVLLNANQIASGMADTWRQIIGQQAAVSVALYVSYEHKFYKFNALGSGEPLSTQATRKNNDDTRLRNTSIKNAVSV